MLRPLLFHALISLAVAAIVGGLVALRHPLFLAFLALEAALSLVEGWYSRGASLSAAARDLLPPEQLAFVMTGKWYLLARPIYQIIVLAIFA